MDSSRIHSLGWRHTTTLEDGIRRTWEAVRKDLTG
jgi:GDP-L-fucose synthase